MAVGAAARGVGCLKAAAAAAAAAAVYAPRAATAAAARPRVKATPLSAAATRSNM